MTDSVELLTPGAQARVYKNGMIQYAVVVPHGRMELRNLQPGDYEIVCEDGTTAAITVDPFSEVALVQVPEHDEDDLAALGPVAAADAPHAILVSPVDTGASEPIFPLHGRPNSDPNPDQGDDGEAAVAFGDPDELGDDPDAPPIAGAPGEPDGSELRGLTVKQLRDRAGRVGVKQGGSKDELVDRIFDAERDQA